jgi:hypothetical protein
MTHKPWRPFKPFQAYTSFQEYAGPYSNSPTGHSIMASDHNIDESASSESQKEIEEIKETKLPILVLAPG